MQAKLFILCFAQGCTWSSVKSLFYFRPCTQRRSAWHIKITFRFLCARAGDRIVTLLSQKTSGGFFSPQVNYLNSSHRLQAPFTLGQFQHWSALCCRSFCWGGLAQFLFKAIGRVAIIHPKKPPEGFSGNGHISLRSHQNRHIEINDFKMLRKSMQIGALIGIMLIHSK